MEFPGTTELCGDIFFKLMHRSKTGNPSSDKLICRFGLHTSFLRSYEGMDPGKVSVSLDRFLVDPNACQNTPGYVSTDFQFKLEFDLVQGEENPSAIYNNDVKNWDEIRQIKAARDNWLQGDSGESGIVHMFRDKESDIE